MGVLLLYQGNFLDYLLLQILGVLVTSLFIPSLAPFHCKPGDYTHNPQQRWGVGSTYDATPCIFFFHSAFKTLSRPLLFLKQQFQPKTTWKHRPRSASRRRKEAGRLLCNHRGVKHYKQGQLRFWNAGFNSLAAARKKQQGQDCLRFFIHAVYTT